MEVDLEFCAEGDVNVTIDSEVSVDQEYETQGQTRYIHRLKQNGKVVFKARTRFVHNDQES